MLLDLVSPWCAAVERADAPHAVLAFRRQHASLLELIRHRRSPLSPVLPLLSDPIAIRSLAARTADPAFGPLIRQMLEKVAHHGTIASRDVVLLAGDGADDAVEVLPEPDGIIALFLDRTRDDQDVGVALARGAALHTRWSASDSRSIASGPGMLADRWEAARQIPLREWIYAEGVALHVAAALVPGMAIDRLLGVSAATLASLRLRERKLRHLLARDLDERGIGLVLRWLTRNAPSSARRADGMVLAAGTGSYLGWRMVRERVERVGLAEAMRMAA